MYILMNLLQKEKAINCNFHYVFWVLCTVNKQKSESKLT